MARMKRFIPILVCILAFAAILPPRPRTEARADVLRYAVAADSNVWFYGAESEAEKLFLIPESYYVRVLYEGDTYSAVEYLVNDPPYRKVMGYCRTGALTFVNFIPARPFLRREITVSYTLPLGNPFDDTFGDIERTFVYYGARYESGQLYYYVLSGDTFGYIPAAEELVFEHNDDYLNVPSEPVAGETDGDGTSDDSKSPDVLQIVLICLACAAAVFVAVLVLKGKRRSPDSEEL